MKIELTEGCILQSLTIDGKSIIDCDKKLLKKSCLKIIDKCTNKEMYYFLGIFIEILGDYNNEDMICLDNLKVDNNAIIFYNNKELPIDKTHKYLLDIINKYLCNEMLFELVKGKGINQYLYTCSTCGDPVYQTTIEL